MNIKYKNIDGKHFAIINFRESEEESAERFARLLSEYLYNSNTEDGIIKIAVDDREDFDYVKDCFKAYKSTDIFNKESKYYSYEAMYETAETDADMYCYLVNEGKTEREIQDIMDEVSGSTDAYQNALSIIVSDLF